MTVSQLSELSADGSAIMQIWDFEEERTVFAGSFDEAIRSEYSNCDIENFEVEDGIVVINI